MAKCRVRAPSLAVFYPPSGGHYLIFTREPAINPTVGGKAESLAWLQQCVGTPPFDVISQDNWSTVMTAGAENLIRTIGLSREPLAVEEARSQLRKKVSGFVSGVSNDYLQACEPFSRIGPVLAVRSSADSEDGILASSAGQYESVLGVDGEDAFRDAVLEVVMSGTSDRAVAYRRRAGQTDVNLFGVSVVVQRMVQANVSGIAFSRNPIDGDDSVVIEAAWGLGTSTVLGLVQPDRFVVDRIDWAVNSRSIGSKKTEEHFDSTTRQLNRVPSQKRASECLTDAEVKSIAMSAVRIEEEAGLPVDIEWAIHDGAGGQELEILQARPMTPAFLGNGVSSVRWRSAF